MNTPVNYQDIIIAIDNLEVIDFTFSGVNNTLKDSCCILPSNSMIFDLFKNINWLHTIIDNTNSIIINNEIVYLIDREFSLELKEEFKKLLNLDKCKKIYGSEWEIQNFPFSSAINK